MSDAQFINGSLPLNDTFQHFTRGSQQLSKSPLGRPRCDVSTFGTSPSRKSSGGWYSAENGTARIQKDGCQASTDPSSAKRVDLKTPSSLSHRKSDAQNASQSLGQKRQFHQKGQVSLVKKSEKLVPTGSALALDVINYFKTESANAVKVICKGEVFWSNKILLSARSPVFNRMLSSNFKESQHQNLEIEDFEPHTVEAFLEGIHTDDCHLFQGKNNGNANEYVNDLLSLYLISDKYEFTHLTKQCADVLCLHVTRKNVLQIYSAIERSQSQDHLFLKCMEILQTIKGADLLELLYQRDLWEPLRKMKIKFVVLGFNPEMSNTKSGKFEMNCCPHDSIETTKSKIALYLIKDRAPGPIDSFEGTYTVDCSNMKLCYAGRPLDKSKTLAECGLFDGSTISIVDGYSIFPSGMEPHSRQIIFY